MILNSDQGDSYRPAGLMFVEGTIMLGAVPEEQWNWLRVCVLPLLPTLSLGVGLIF